MKKTLIAFVLLILTFVMAIQVGCGSFSPPVDLPDPPLPGDDKPQKPDGSEEEHDIFRVYLVDESGNPFYPTQPIYAQWTGEEGLHSAPINEEGYAQVLDLDGEYRVTLDSLPSNYTYDPNNNFVDNVNPDVTIEIKRILGKYDVNDGSGQYAQAQISQLGTYRVSIGSKSDGVFFNYTPTAGGIYSIESWADITANIINPIVDEYNGSFAWNNKLRTVDGGGSESTYTKNFRMTMTISDDQVGNSKIFAVHADTIGNNYPLVFDFTIKYEGKPPEVVEVYEKVKPQGPYNRGENKDIPTGKFTYIYGTSKILDEDLVAFNEDDGYYHVFNPKTGQMGGILYVIINKDSEIGNTESGDGFLDSYFGLKFFGYDYYDFIDMYSYYCNNDGAHPVTAELKDFLFNYAIYRQFFYDGYGWAESRGFNSGEDDQWLFACGYYA